MSSAKKSKLAARCRCCLGSGDLKNMWSETADDGTGDVYGELLAECFAISLQPTEHLELICGECVRQLRNSCQFKKMVLASDEILSNGATKEDETMSDGEYTKQSMEEDDAGVEYLEVEFLEEDINADVKEETEEETAARRKRKRLVPPRNKYTKKELSKAMNAVKRDLMTRLDAAKYYNIPYKTLSAKLKAEEVANRERPESSTEEDEAKTINDVSNSKFIEEIQTLLTYTNVAPFKTKTCRLYCAYCSTDPTPFEDTVPTPFEHPDGLRTHIRTRHINDRVKGVDIFMRPCSQNEVLKVDIDSLICTVCCLPIDSWNGMFEHLAEKHEVVFEQVTDKVIPFRLGEEYTCALCGETHSTFGRLDGHMNAHYSNYICGKCGDTFLSESRLRSHEDNHRTGIFSCKYCSKVFTLEKYRKKHTEMVHLSRNLREPLKCRHCPRKFSLEQERHQHETTDPRCAEMKNNTCTVCEKVFSCRQYYLSHMRLRHRETGNKHECGTCGKHFKLLHDLKTHEGWHTGRFVCQICDRRFASKQSLMTHMKRHVGVIVSAFKKTKT